MPIGESGVVMLKQVQQRLDLLAFELTLPSEGISDLPLHLPLDIVEVRHGQGDDGRAHGCTSDPGRARPSIVSAANTLR